MGVGGEECYSYQVPLFFLKSLSDLYFMLEQFGHVTNLEFQLLFVGSRLVKFFLSAAAGIFRRLPLLAALFLVNGECFEFFS